MKRLLFLLLAMFATTAAEAQRRVTLRQCEGDTVAYLRQNFEQGKARFVGKPFSKVLDEWQQELPVGLLVFGSTGSWPTDEREKDVVDSASVRFITEQEQNLRMARKEVYYSLSVVFAPPFYQKIDPLWDIQEEEGTLSPRLYELIKDFVVKDIVLVEIKF